MWFVYQCVCSCSAMVVMVVLLPWRKRCRLEGLIFWPRGYKGLRGDERERGVWRDTESEREDGGCIEIKAGISTIKKKRFGYLLFILLPE